MRKGNPHRPYQITHVCEGFAGLKGIEVPKSTSWLRKYRFDLGHRLALGISQNVPVAQSCRRVGVTQLPLCYRRACGLKKLSPVGR